jgi:hypothetical protein
LVSCALPVGGAFRISREGCRWRKIKMLKREEEVSREWDEEEAPERRELIILLGC